MEAVTFIDYADKGQQMQRLTENTAGNSNVRQLLKFLIMFTINKYIIPTITVIGFFSLQSCDPARILVLRAANKPNYSVTIYANENILPQSYPYHQDSVAKKIVLRVPSNDAVSQREKIFFYGLGGWGDNSLMPDFSKNIDSIIIVDNNGKLILDKQKEINDYFLRHRHGFAKRILRIEAN